MKKHHVGVFALTMLISGAVYGAGSLPSMAIFGPQLIFFFILASLLFLLPSGLISAELSSQFKRESGVYVWADSAFGKSFAALAIWLQWINTIVWLPTCLSTVVATVCYLFDPTLMQHPLYVVMGSLGSFWFLTWLNLKGIKQSSRIAAWAVFGGMVIPMILLIGMTALWLILGKPVAIHFNAQTMAPHLGSSTAWVSIIAIITSFSGIELASVHGEKIRNARLVIPRALILSIALIVFIFGFGSLSIALVVPSQNMSFVAGTMQAFSALCDGFHMPWMVDVIGIMILAASAGTMASWLISPANGLAQAARNNYLPRSWSKENKHGLPSRILILQGVVISVISCVFFLMPSINGSYWLLIGLSTELYAFMYVLMFASGIRIFLRSKKINLIPGGKVGGIIVCLTGLLGCIMALIVGFFPPSNINVGEHLHYILLFASGIVLLASPALLLIGYKKFSKSAVNKADSEFIPV